MINYTMAVCEQCSLDNKWQENLDYTLKHKEDYQKFKTTGLPANHPLVEAINEYWDNRKRNCVQVIADDGSIALSICNLHIMRLAMKLL